MKQRQNYLVTAALMCGLVACKQDQTNPNAEPTTSTSVRALDPCDPVNVDQSMVVRDQATIGLADFSFQRTIQTIRTTSGGNPTTDAALAQSLTTGLTTNPFINPVSGLPMPAQIRTAEANLTGSGLLTQMQPIALFNRFDLAPADGSNCGEYRIVYGRYPNATLNRYLLIFESRLPNPNPGLGIEGCRPIAEFWHDLSDPGHSNQDRATLLANFYYNGLPGFSAVVTHSNYGMPLGQVRANMFRQQPWQLREWRTTLNGSGQPEFMPDTDKDNPLAQLYSENSSNPNPALFTTEQSAFQSDFTANRMTNLLNFELNGSTLTACPEVNSVGAGFLNRFNEFQGDSQGNADNPNTIASTNFRTAIDGVLAGNPAFAGLTNTHVLNRAGSVTCGGCHQFTAGQPIAPGINWPQPAAGGFVHVRELGAAPPAITPLSGALTGCFLPARQQILETFVCQGGGSPDAGVTDSGPADSGSVADSGTPDAGPTACGGPYGATCAATEYCEFGAYNTCGVNGPGVCTPRPTACPYGGSQVCGCDGQTYGSDCLANQAGTDVASSGACSSTCNLAPRRGCCFDDGDCSGKDSCIGEVCQANGEGICKGPPGAGKCWEQGDCRDGERCVDARICPCGQSCLQPDQAGTCRVISDIEMAQAAPRSPSGGSTMSSSSTTESAPAPTVSSAKQAVLDATTPTEVEQARVELNQAVEDERAREAALPGAFRPVRRTH